MVRRKVTFSTLSASILLAAMPAKTIAQTAPTAEAPSVTVTAPAPAAALPRLIRQSGQADGSGRLARWDRPVCPKAIGLPVQFNTFIEQRITGVAKEVGAVSAGQGCSPNILVLITPRADELSNMLVGLKARALAGGRWPLDKIRLQAFVNERKPIRWFFVSENIQSSGGVANEITHSDLSSALQDQFFGNSALPSAPSYDHVVPSRLDPAGDQSFSQVVIVVDAKKIAGLTAGQLSSYLAMASLAQLRSDTTFDSENTIMNLFSPDHEQSPPIDLTTWDRAYLTALYRTDGQVTGALQASHMAAYVKQAYPARSQGSSAASAQPK